MNVAIIPARGGSQRIARKNIKPFLGKPIIAYAISAAQASGCFERIIVSTDDPEIAAIALYYGAEVPFMRPANISDDHALTMDVMTHCLAYLSAQHTHPDYVCCLYATAPFLRPEDIGRAMAILEMAKRSGADAVKLQTYTQDTLTLNCTKPDFMITDGLWQGQTLYDLYSEAHMPWAWHQPLFRRARELELTIFSSPFDQTAVDYLEDLNAPAYKIASFEVIDLPLIKYVAQTGKPMILSTGMANAEEIAEAIDVAHENGCTELAVLHCVSGYPAPPQDYNLRTLQDIARQFSVLTGLSDHTLDNTTAITAVALGACIIEKHVTLNRAGGGPDDSFSLEEPDLTQLCEQALTAWQALGNVNYSRQSSEQGNSIFRRSLYVVKDIKVGKRFTADNVKSIRPGYGLAPKHIDAVLGSIAKTNISRGTALALAHFTNIA